MAATAEEKSVIEMPRRQREVAPRIDTAFSSIEAFEGAQRMATALAKSDLVPKQYAGNMPNCILALEMSQRLGMNPLMVMQHMYIVHGKPAWSAQFLIACVNGSGHFSPMRYELTGKEGSDNRACVAWAYDQGTGDRLDSPAVSIGMARKEGWYDKNGSKWQTMPELMLRYRAATFFARTYCPELSMGMKTVEEIHDIGEVDVVDDDPLTPGRHEARKKATKTAPEVSDDQDTESSTDDAHDSSEPEEAESLPDACTSYRELLTAMQRTPAFVERAIIAAASKHDECMHISKFPDIDHTDEAVCNLVLVEYRRVHDAAKGK